MLESGKTARRVHDIPLLQIRQITRTLQIWTLAGKHSRQIQWIGLNLPQNEFHCSAQNKMKIAILVSFFSLTLGMRLSAFLRGHITDEEGVAQAQLIVIGHFKKGSLVRSQEGQCATSASAVLIVSKVLKGPFAIEEIPIEIHYGLTPVTGGDTGKGHIGEHVKAGEVQIFDTGNSCWSDAPITGNLNQDQIWLLRVNPDGTTGGLPGSKLKVWSPEEIQPVSKQDVLLSLIEKQRIKEKKQAEVVSPNEP